MDKREDMLKLDCPVHDATGHTEGVKTRKNNPSQLLLKGVKEAKETVDNAQI